MDESGIAPPPLERLTENQSQWVPWDMWFKRLVLNFPRVRTYTVVFDPASVSANTTSEQTVAVVGLSISDIIIVTKPTHTTGLGIVNVRASADDTLAVTFMNATGSPINPPSESYLVCATRR